MCGFQYISFGQHYSREKRFVLLDHVLTFLGTGYGSIELADPVWGNNFSLIFFILLLRKWKTGVCLIVYHCIILKLYEHLFRESTRKNTQFLAG